MSTTTAGLLDTNTFILIAEMSDSEQLPAEPLISTVTLAELALGPLATNDPVERARRQAQLQAAEASFDPIPFDRDAARSFADVVASLREAGRKTTARSLDAMIAATALSRGLPLYTCNPSDFVGIDGLDVVAVPNPRAS